MPENAVHTYVTAVATKHTVRYGFRVVDGIKTEHNSVVLLTRQDRPQDNGVWLVREEEWVRPVASVFLAAGGKTFGDTTWARVADQWTKVL